MSSSKQVSSLAEHAGAAAVANARLVVVEGRASKQEVELRLPAVIGRGHDATVLVKHASVSRSHCEIAAVDGALVVRDMNSKNGTIVGDARVVEAILKPGDRLTVGPLTFRVDYEVRPPAANGKPAPEAAGRDEPAKPVTDDDVVSFLFE